MNQHLCLETSGRCSNAADRTKPKDVEPHNRNSRRGRLLAAAGLSLAIGAGAVATTAGTSSASPASARHSVVRAIRVRGYGLVLGNSRRTSLYLLSNEAHHKLRCRGGCLDLWRPLYVKKGARLTSSSGVKGRLGTVARGSKEQVTFNSYPLYTFAGDNGRVAQSKGEGVAFGHRARWYLVRASARSAAATPVKHKTSGGSTTTTTTAGGGYGY